MRRCCLHTLVNEEVVMGYRAIVEWENALGWLRHNTFTGNNFLAVKKEAEGWIERQTTSGNSCKIKETKIYTDSGAVIPLPPRRKIVRAQYPNDGSTDAHIVGKAY